MASICSAAISFACHNPKEDSDALMFLVEWGVVGYNGDGVGHYSSTTSRDFTCPTSGELYA